MDHFIEQIVKKRFSWKDYALFVLIFIAGLVVIGLSMIFLRPFVILVLAGVCFGIYYIITSRNLEFEYSVTNGDITIDKIIFRRSRKRVVSLDAHAIEEIGKYDPEKMKGKSFARFTASAFEDGRDSWYFIADIPKKGRSLVVFSPNEEVLEAIRLFLPRQVAVNAFGRR